MATVAKNVSKHFEILIPRRQERTASSSSRCSAGGCLKMVVMVAMLLLQAGIDGNTAVEGKEVSPEDTDLNGVAKFLGNKMLHDCRINLKPTTSIKY